jgi:hypothetical protein
MLGFYLAQPTPEGASGEGGEFDGGVVNESLLRQARGWFVKALEIEGSDEVALEFVRLIDAGSEPREGGMSDSSDSDTGEDQKSLTMSSDEDDEDDEDEADESFDAE